LTAFFNPDKVKKYMLLEEMNMKAKIAVIGGSGAYRLLKQEIFGAEKKSKRIQTPFGESGVLHFFGSSKQRFVFLSRHGESGYEISAPFVNYRANIWALKEAGAERIISWSGPGIINTSFGIGDYLLPHDLIDETKSRESTFFDKTGLGFIRQSEPFCPETKEALAGALNVLNLRYHASGVYVCTQGPRLETPAEIKKFGILGGDVVGMTLVPEAFLARELEICYAPLCYLTNFAEGVKERPFQKGKLFEGMQTETEAKEVDEAVSRFPAIILEAIKLLSAAKRECLCKDVMGRYKRSGLISEDWTRWIKRP
jgi:5'-methylthioadenosine phosphorylase